MKSSKGIDTSEPLIFINQLYESEKMFNVLESYINVTESSIEKRIKETEDQGKLVYSNPNADEDEIIDWRRENEFNKEIPQYFYKSIIVTIHSVFENQLIEMCRVFELNGIPKIPPDQLRREIFENVLNFIKNKITFQDETVEFTEIKKVIEQLSDYNKIRNFIIHQDGDINNFKNPGDNKKKEVSEIFKSGNTLATLNNNGKLFIKEINYLTAYNTSVYNFVYFIFKKSAPIIEKKKLFNKYGSQTF